MAVSGKRAKTKIQRAPAIGEKSRVVSFSCETVCRDVDDLHELVADTGEVQKRPDDLATESSKPVFLHTLSHLC